MSKLLLLVISISLLLGGCVSSAGTIKETDDFDPAVLSDAAREAYQKLLSAPRVESEHVGYKGELSEFAQSLSLLLAEPNADDALKSILKSGTLPGQVYALRGLKTTDREFFQKVLSNYKNRDEMVETLDGCLGGREKVSQVVESL